MTREELFDRIQDIFRDIFDEDDMIIEDKTSSDDIEEWDSLNYVNIISTIEREFEIRFTLREIQALKDVGAIVDLMQEKIGK